MGAREQHRVVSVSARPSSWPLVEWPWLRATKGVHAAIPSIPTTSSQRMLHDRLFDKLSDCQLLATVGVRMTSPAHRAPSTAPIQYP